MRDRSVEIDTHLLEAMTLAKTGSRCHVWRDTRDGVFACVVSGISAHDMVLLRTAIDDAMRRSGTRVEDMMRG